ncbi:MAG: UDP-N-acetylmuramoyl-tripeptide--D-alanyl-D-alanine ligase [Clostridiales bacterium]|nr:UDP-N-acetylmuramoyl-tripeptide--D-alanyl-D-alanine ligase [Clostridiales bacterium]
MKNIRIRDIVEATGGRLLCGDPETLIENISIDSRTMKGKDIFVPIIGAKVDAHRFIQGAFQAGAIASFTSEHQQMEDSHPWIYVEDTVKALQDLGAYYRKKITFPIVGVTGSVGKTTTREMIVAALSAEKRVTSTSGNSNGQLGVPLTLCEMDLDADIAVLEMGMSEPGEMARIAAVAKPDLGVVTNIGVSHIENLGSRDNICREKMHMADGFSYDNVMILNGDDDILPGFQTSGQYRKVYYGQGENCQYRAEKIRTEEGRTCFTANIDGRQMELSLAVPGVHHVMNALAALAVAHICGVDLEKAGKKLEEFHGFARRLQIITKDDYTYVDDTYNASPDSMKAALQVLDSISTQGRRIAVLADMLELGPNSPRFHYEVGVYGRELKIDQVFVIGELAAHIGKAFQEKGISAVFCEGNQEAAAKILEYRKPGDVILLKGSNGMHLGEVLQAITE